MYLLRPKKFVFLHMLILFLVCLLAACGGSSAPPKVHTSPPTPTPTPSPTPSPTPTPIPLVRPALERGMIYPGWNQASYGDTDVTWQQGIKTIKQLTGANWLEMPVLLTQSTSYTTDVHTESNAPTVASFSSGIRKAISLGYHVFFIPLLGVKVAGDWSGTVQIPAAAQQAWFDNYWNALRPYAIAAQASGAEQMAIGTEIVWLEDNAPSTLWNQLIARVSGVFHGKLTYDLNWSPSLYDAPASWLKNPALSALGVSEYIPLTSSQERVTPSAMISLWKEKVRSYIDTFSAAVGKPMLVSEIGYRDSSDALYNPYSQQSSLPTDQQEQAGAFNATLSNVFGDSRIIGVFFWGWAEVGRLGISDNPSSIATIDNWYTKPAP